MIQLEMFQILRQLNLVTMLILVVCKRHVIHEHCYGQIQHRVLRNPVSEHRRLDSKDLWVDSFWGSTSFLFSYALCEKKRMEYSNVLNQILDSYFLRSLIIFVISYGKSTFPLKLFFTNCRISRYLQQYTNGFKDELRKTMNPEML